MEQSLPLIAKKAWGMVRVLIFMVRRSIISKRKLLLLDLNMAIKRGNKIASKAIGNLKFHHHHNHRAPSVTDVEEAAAAEEAVKMALEMVNATCDVGGDDGGGGVNVYAATPSPVVLPRRRKGVTRSLRITDSPFPLREDDGGDNGVVDRKADEFIANFYRQLQQQQ